MRKHRSDATQLPLCSYFACLWPRPRTTGIPCRGITRGKRFEGGLFYGIGDLFGCSGLPRPFCHRQLFLKPFIHSKSDFTPVSVTVPCRINTYAETQGLGTCYR